MRHRKLGKLAAVGSAAALAMGVVACEMDDTANDTVESPDPAEGEDGPDFEEGEPDPDPADEDADIDDDGVDD